VKRLKIELGEQSLMAASPFTHMANINPALVAQYCELLNNLQMQMQVHESRLPVSKCLLMITLIRTLKHTGG
jgi:hypothetical protein